MRALQMKLQVPPQLYSQVHPAAERIPKETELLSTRPCNHFLIFLGAFFPEGLEQQICEIKTFKCRKDKIADRGYVR